MLKTPIKETGMNGVGARFHLGNPVEELTLRSSNFTSVTAKSYLSGCRLIGTKYGMLNTFLNWMPDVYVHMKCGPLPAAGSSSPWGYHGSGS